MEKISLKNNPAIKEDLIQSFIFENPSILGLGELSPIQREKVQPAGGRLDMLLANDDGTRYEVEIQLGATDPSHIIRTIEYWDVERKRYPQYDHCAVIVAEEITGRFMNVISLFNGTIPLIAIQMSAYKNGDDYVITFTKVLDRLSMATDDEESYEAADRSYWENRSTAKMMKNVDAILNSLDLPANGYELKYNKFYIGITKNGLVKNFIEFKPKKNFLYFVVKGNEDSEKLQMIENEGFEVQYVTRWKEYNIRVNSLDQFMKHKDMFIKLVKDSMDYYNVSYED